MNATEFAANVRKLSTPALINTDKDKRLVKKLSHVICSYLRRAAERLIGLYPSSPVLYAYLSDGWGCYVEETFVDPSCVVVRKGRSRAEFLLERGIIKVLDDNDHVHMAMILSHPRGMTLGKKAWNVFTAACDFSLC